MSIQSPAFNISFDSLFRRTEKKMAAPTVELISKILTNAGLDEGEWVLRDSHRIKKKGRDRFHAIRVESRGGAKSVRIWCKPRGNDTCFEYSLVPPADVEAEIAFSVLRRANPVTLQVPESRDLPEAFLRRVIGIPDKPTERIPILEVADKAPREPLEEREEENRVELRPTTAEAAAALESPIPNALEANDMTTSEEKGRSLLLDESVILSDQEVMDKALLAISFVAQNGYARKNEASNSIVENLGLKNFVSQISGGTYTSIEGAMRALTMALRTRGRYIERVHYTTADGRASEGVRGYKITAKGEKRIMALRDRYDESVASKIAPRWSSESESANGVTPSPSERPSEEIVMVSEIDSLTSAGIAKLRSLLDEHQTAESHAKEVDAILANLDLEVADLRLDLTAFELAEKEKMRQIQELERDIERIKTKREPVEQKIKQKMSERGEWERDKAPMVAKKTTIENEISGLTGRRKM